MLIDTVRGESRALHLSVPEWERVPAGLYSLTVSRRQSAEELILRLSLKATQVTLSLFILL